MDAVLLKQSDILTNRVGEKDTCFSNKSVNKKEESEDEI